MRKANVLVAYPYLAGVLPALRERADEMRLVIDSGAFTAWKARKPIALDDYCRALESMPVPPWRYFALDVIGDPAATMRNYEIMRARGFSPIPVFTRGEDPSVLDDLYATSEVVGIGGLVGTAGNRGFVNGIMRHVAGRKVHWLGFTRSDYLIRWKPYMADSSTWGVGGVYGNLPVYLGRGEVRQVYRRQYQNGLEPGVLAFLQRVGVDPNAIRSKANTTGGEHNILRWTGALAHVWRSLDVERKIRTHLFLAVGSTTDVRHVLDARRQLHERGVI